MGGTRGPDQLVYHTLFHIMMFVYGSLPVLFALYRAAVVLAGLRALGRARSRSAQAWPLAPRPFSTLVAAIIYRVLNYTVGRNPGVLWSKHPYDVLVAYGAYALVARGYRPIVPGRRQWGDARDPGGLGAATTVRAVEAGPRLARHRLGRALGWIFLLWLLTPH